MLTQPPQWSRPSADECPQHQRPDRTVLKSEADENHKSQKSCVKQLLFGTCLHIPRFSSLKRLSHSESTSVTALTGSHRTHARSRHWAAGQPGHRIHTPDTHTRALAHAEDLHMLERKLCNVTLGILFVVPCVSVGTCGKNPNDVVLILLNISLRKKCFKAHTLCVWDVNQSLVLYTWNSEWIVASLAWVFFCFIFFPGNEMED